MSSRDLKDAIMGAGIVPKNAVAQMERWQTMPAGSSSRVGPANVNKVQELKDDLDLCLAPICRESILDIKKLMEEARPVDLIFDNLTVLGVLAGVDRLGRYIIEIGDSDENDLITSLIHPFTKIMDMSLEPPKHYRTITAVSLICKTERRGKSQVSVPTHWFCETESEGEETIIKGV
ncbi:MAG: hypothetical protein ACFFFC_00735 [Candidatus Thorarchaeota archaeon]